MNTIFKEYLSKFVATSLDDVLMFSRDEKTQNLHLEIVFKKLKEAEFNLNLKNVNLQKECYILGISGTILKD